LASLSDDGEVLEQARRVARELLEEARRVAQAIVRDDPSLERHPGLCRALAEQRRRQAEVARLN
ncbi:MAG: hypothetical protein ACKOPN_13645, partial [Prochlorococcaceae cyanobacterium]